MTILENEIGTKLIQTAVHVHRVLGPGLLEKVYEAVMAYELREKGLCVERQVVVPMVYKGIRFDEGFRADLVIENLVIVELKSVDSINYAHTKQLHSYLRLMNLRLGYVLNFGEALLRDGIKRIVNGLPEK